MSEIRYGKWIDCSNGWMCSECEEDNISDTLYCPHCGAKMINATPREYTGKKAQIIEVLEQMEAAMGRLGGTRAEIWQNDIIYCLCRAVWLFMTWELKKL